MFSVGDKVCLSVDKDSIGIVVSVLPPAGEIQQYQVFHNASNTAIYIENQLEAITTTDNPSMVSCADFKGLYAAQKMRMNASDSLFSLNSGKIKFIPFQFRPLSRILNAERPRILIADEVGVGKTIETGIIIKEFEKRDSVKSIIIICPKDLTSKWRHEMKYRFDEAFEVLSSERLRYCLDELEMEGWPSECGKCIISLEMLRREENINRLEAMEYTASFDMLILDEAHHVINANSNSHRVIEYFCGNCDITVFLSATPLQLGSGDLFSLLNLLLPDEFMDESLFDAMAEPNHYINAAIHQVRNMSAANWQEKAVTELRQVCVNDWATRTFSSNTLLDYWICRLSEPDHPVTDEERIACLRDLESLHTFSHVINRTKRKDIGEFTIREPITVLTEYTESEQKFYDAVREFKYSTLSSRYGDRTANLIMSTIERQITSCLPAFVSLLGQFITHGLLSLSELSDDIDSEENDVNIKDTAFYEFSTHLRELAQNLPSSDSKTQKLMSIIHETLQNTEAGKLLVFSFFKHTLSYLFDVIDADGVRVAVITGETSMEVRDDLRNRFRLPKDNPDAIDVLLCSEVGCEGLDYEFCSRMVNYDIPWNPMKIEQRIGRIDRFGQKSSKVQIYNFITSNTVEEKIFYRCYERLGIFNSTVGDLEGVLGNIVTELTQTAFDSRLTEEQQISRARQLTDNAIRLAEEQRQFENTSKELFLMDIEMSDSSVIGERLTQIQWQINLLCAYLKHEFPKAAYSNLSDSQLEVRVFKQDKQVILSNLAQLKRCRKVDRNSQQVVLLENYLLSDEQTIILNFDGNTDDKKSLFVSATHPLLMMALDAVHPTNDMFFSSFSVSSNIVNQGKYVFACYEWQERGYRQSNRIQVVLYDLLRKQPTTISLSDFENLLLSSTENGNITKPDLSAIVPYIFQEQQVAKKRLMEINDDIVIRKLSTLKEYYSKQIERTRHSLEQSKNDRICTMYRARIQKLEFAWQEKQTALQNRLQADILVKLFAAGEMEVK